MKLKFIGGTETVTGSSYLLTVENKNILIDFGMFQEENIDNKIYDFDPKIIDFVIVTHAHIDHIGRIPLLFKDGFKGKVFCSKETFELSKLMLNDSAKIQLNATEEENKQKIKVGLDPIEPLYNTDDVDNALAYFYPISFNTTRTIDNIDFTLKKSGHILGAASVLLTINDQGLRKTLCFSGDLGNKNNLLLDPPEYIENCDYLVIESTYGNRIHQNIESRRNKLGEILLKVYKSKEFALIPSFSLGRTQNIILELKELIKNQKYKELSNLPIFIDSPLGLNATKIYEENKLNLKDTISNKSNIFKMKNINFVNELKDTFALIKSKNPKLIISSSGMCNGGKILFYLKELLNKSSTNIIFIGYQAENTLGRDILSKMNPVYINKKKFKVEAKIWKIDGYSAHADQNDLINWVKNIKKSPDIIFITHGEDESRIALRKKLLDLNSKNLILPKTNQIFNL